MKTATDGVLRQLSADQILFSRANSDRVKQLAREADAVGACRVAWAEVHAAFARSRENPDDLDTIERAKLAFATDWHNWLISDVTQELVEEAGQSAAAFALRAYDSIQLAAARSASERTTVFEFATFDRPLNRAARKLGMQVPFLLG